jgi:hypothetical protein
LGTPGYCTPKRHELVAAIFGSCRTYFLVVITHFGPTDGLSVPLGRYTPFDPQLTQTRAEEEPLLRKLSSHSGLPRMKKRMLFVRNVQSHC